LHAHRTLRQAAVAVSGQCTIEFDDGQSRSSVDLNDPATLVMIEPMIWHEMRSFSPDCVLLVLADAVYDERDYIRDRAEFLRLVNEN
jgi:dTDP-4-dehydrorhamnose 3,5-epimerase-like enzyme